MKIAKLFVLSALLLMGNSAMAEIVDGVRQQPKPKTVGFQAETEAYLYNVDAAQFFTQGNAWGTQASTSTAGGLKVKFAKYTLEGAEWDGKTYLFNDYRNDAWFYVFFDSESQMYVDLGNQTDKNTGWEVEENGATFRLSASSTVPTNIPGKTQTFTGGLTKVEGQYVGLDLSADANNTALHPFLAPGEGICLNWALVSVEDYEALVPQLAAYAASVPLKELLDRAKEIGADVAAQEAVYLNEESTVEELNAAVEAAKAAVDAKEKELAQGEMGKATADNPVSATAFIVNPDFVGDNLTTGWSGDAFGSYGPKENAEHYEKTYDTYQTIEGLPNGVYAVGVNAFYRAGGAETAYRNYKNNTADSRNAKLYATTGDDTMMANIVSPFKGAPTEATGVGTESYATDGDVTYYIPNNMEAAEYYMHTLGLYGNTVFNAVEDGTITIGVRKDVTVGTDWSIFDDFSLTYYGNGADAYQKWLDSAVSTYDIYGDGEITAIHTAKYAEDYAAVFATLGEQKVSNKAEVIAAIESAEAVADALTQNISLWAQFETLVAQAKEVAADATLNPEYTEPLADWAEFDAEDILAALDLTNEELQAIVEEKTVEIDEARKHPAGAGADMTKLLKNPDFEQGREGWTVEAASGGNVNAGGTSTNTCFEAWNNGGFDIYQVVEGAPMGVYEISVQGFYRYGRGQYSAYLAQEADEVKPGKAPVYVYMNDNQTSLTNVYGDPKQIDYPEFYSELSSDFDSEQDNDGNTWYFPNGMASAAVAFSDGMYTQSAYGVVAQEGDVMRIGVKGVSNQLGDSWSIWDNFKLTFQGYDNVETVQPILEKVLETSKVLAASNMGKSVNAALQEAIDNATAAIAGGEGVPMFNALSALLKNNTAATASAALFTALETANDDLSAAIVTAVAGNDVIAEATALRNEIAGKIASGELEDSDVEGLQAEIAAMVKKLNVPEEMAGASDANPVDCTSMIENPYYDNGNNDGWTIDAGTGFNSGLIECYNSNFDEYQVLEGLPEGTYTVTVQGFYRYGFAEGEYAAYTEDPTANNYLSLYAQVGDNEYAAAMPRLASDGAEEHTSTLVENGQFVAGDDLGGDAWMWIWMTEPEANADSTAATGVRIANGMIPVATLFGQGKFAGTEVTFVVGEEGTARIGLKKQEEKNTDGSWCIWDNWKLTYYGPNSTKTPTETGIKDAADKATVVKTEIFNLNGARINNAAKGIVIVKETLSNGTVKVKKVTVK